jgi:hypothetical protein
MRGKSLKIQRAGPQRRRPQDTEDSPGQFFSLQRAGVAELADAQDLGSCGVTPVEVQVLSPAPYFPLRTVPPLRPILVLNENDALAVPLVHAGVILYD